MIKISSSMAGVEEEVRYEYGAAKLRKR